VTTVVLTGAAGALGRRVLAILARDPEVRRVVAVDRTPIDQPAAGVDAVTVDLADADLKAVFEGAEAVVHLAADATRRVLDAAGAVGARHVVLLSSATVYGAWPTNPVPLTEDAPLRPNPGFDLAVRRAEDERLAAEHRDAHPGTTIAVLRPVPTVAEDGCSPLAALLNDAPSVLTEAGADDPPAQYLHFDDLASAVAMAVHRHLDGPYNVAPDGWISREQVRALRGSGLRLPLPEPVAHRLATLRWRLRLRPVPPAVLPYLTNPWVVANDRLRAAGWTARHTNEEAFVAGHQPGPFATMSPRRRQELLLGGAAVLLAGAVTGVVLLARRVTRRRRASPPPSP
jgi:nucleoside-diphosphate-sugar epimerase